MYQPLEGDAVENRKTGTRCIRRGDIILIASIVFIAGAMLWGRTLFSGAGTQAVITTTDGETAISLDRDAEWTLEGNNGITVVIQVQNGCVRFKESGCPDKICVHSGWLSQKGQSAACLPAGIALRITDGTSSVDAVAG